MNDRVIGHYQIVEQIGAGAMGEVFRARDRRLGRDVALKLIRATSNSNPDHVRRFELEARAAAALNHPNIVAVYDVGQDEGTPYIVCELLQGKTLRQRLQEGPLPLRVAVSYAIQIAQGLAAAHERRIIHRDLKPENLFVTTDSRIKILDFGVAKLQPSAEDSPSPVEDLTTVTKHGAIVGTVAYMSPEQLRARPIDHRSDIFSMGGILYEMLTGRRPFRGETEVDTITAVLKESPPEHDLEKANIPAALQQIIAHCLEKEADNRFQTARDLIFALETLSGSSTDRVVRRESPKAQSGALPWVLASLLLATGILLVFSLALRTSSSSPSYRRVTFDQGTVYSARFSPDYRSIIYGAAWNRRPLQLFTTVGNSLLSQPHEVTDGSLLAVSKTGELALAMHGVHTSHLLIDKATLARAPLAGGSPREILEDVSWADWDEKGELAIIHHAAGRYRIEYPIGRVLYQSEGWISHLRFSPHFDKIAFINHPSLWDDRGSVFVMDLGGKTEVISKEWDSADGVAWTSDGAEVWFTAADKGYTRGLFALSGKGKIHNVLTIPAGMTLHDIAPDGRVLVSLDAERLSMATSLRGGKPVDISWHDWDIAKDISRDGKSVLFEDASEAAGTSYSVALRRIDGSAPIQLGDGSAGGLSPDGQWAIAIITGSPGSVTLYPVGPGTPRRVPVTGLETIDNGTSHFLPDGKTITVNGNEPGHGVRCYLVNIDTGKLTPATPEGVTGGLVSPDGKFITANNGTNATMYPIGGGVPRSIPNVDPGFVALQWSEDNSAIYGYLSGEIPTGVYEINIATGERILVQELSPEAAPGLVTIKPVVVSHDLTRFAYSYYQVLSVLYVISGLR